MNDPVASGRDLKHAKKILGPNKMIFTMLIVIVSTIIGFGIGAWLRMPSVQYKKNVQVGSEGEDEHGTRSDNVEAVQESINKIKSYLKEFAATVAHEEHMRNERVIRYARERAEEQKELQCLS